MPNEVYYTWAFLVAYAAGSIPFGFLLARGIKGVDIRQHGSGNIGATNAGRVLGWKWFPVVMLLDAFKGFAPVFWVAPWVSRTWPCEICPMEDTLLPAISGLLAILGHVFPVYLKMRGGRGVATGIGVVLALEWRAGVAALAIWAVLLLVTRYASVASVLAAAAVPAAWFYLEPDPWGHRIPNTLLFILAAVIVAVRHVPNFKRIAAGTEDRLWSTKRST